MTKLWPGGIRLDYFFSFSERPLEIRFKDCLLVQFFYTNEVFINATLNYPKNKNY